jgi:5'-nucleotidase
MRKTVYIDMDNVLVNFQTGIDRLSEQIKQEYEGRLDEVPGIFGLMEPMTGAFNAVKNLNEYFDLYVLSTAPWRNPSAWSDKAIWIQKYFGSEPGSIFYKKLIISHHKNLNKGDFLIDDREKNGANDFEGELILFGSERFKDWGIVTEYLMNKKG